ncbi:MAG TPA: response regulator [Vicinamibacterales bacterium]|nr:response regulator [Vicinamibacterales bacterium]
MASALLVESNLVDALAVTSALTECGLRVTVADSFAIAKDRLNAQPPEVLVTAVKLAEYNGLHLVLRAKSQRPDIAALVLSDAQDVVLQAEAEALDATFMVKPIDAKELTAAVFRTISAAKSFNRAAEPIRAPFERRTASRRVADTPTPHERRMKERRREVTELLRFAATRPRR